MNVFDLQLLSCGYCGGMFEAMLGACIICGSYVCSHIICFLTKKKCEKSCKCND